MTIKFTGPGVTKHQGKEFLPGAPLDFLDDRVEEYFVGAGWAEPTDDEPVFTYPVGYVTVDTTIVDNLTGARILADEPISLEAAKEQADARKTVHEHFIQTTPPDPLSVEANMEVLQGLPRTIQPERAAPVDEESADEVAPSKKSK